MMRLCFGTLGKVLKLCKLENVSDVKLIGTLTRTVDPDCEYINSDGTAVSKLLSCTQNLSNGQKRRVGQTRDGETFEQGEETNRLSDIVSMARTADVNEVAAKIQEDVLVLLDDNMKEDIAPALFRIVLEDDSLTVDHHAAFENATGLSREQFLAQSGVCLPLLLAELLLYSATALRNREGKDCVGEITREYLVRARDLFPNVSVSYALKPRPVVAESVLPPEEKIQVYIKKGTEKMSVLKTLLYSVEPVPFYSFYVCNDIRYCPYGRDYYVSPDTYEEDTKMLSGATLEKLDGISRFLVIQGTGGLGKSMMMRHLFLDTAAKYLPGGVVPVFIPVRYFGEKDLDLESFVFSRFNLFGTGFTRKEFAALLQSGRFLLLFDGFDEISESCMDAFVAGMESLTDMYPDNRFILSSRPFNDFLSMNRFSELHLEPLKKEQALSLVRRLRFRPDVPEIKEKFLQALDQSLFASHRDFAENPLLLTIMLMTFEEYAEVPTKMNLFYREAFQTLARRHDASKGAYKRQFRTGLPAETLESYFAEFCARSYREGKYSFRDDDIWYYFVNLLERKKRKDDQTRAEDFLYDLCANLCLLYRDGSEYSFTHRSFQEYFTALYFSRQLEETMPKIAGFLESRASWNRGDRVLSMMYEICPEKLDSAVFLPMLRDLARACREGEGYWTYLQKVYAELEYEDGDTSGARTIPYSYLYAFIREQFFPDYTTRLDLPPCDVLPSVEYFYLPDGECIPEEEIRPEYLEFGSLESSGFLYTVETEELLYMKDKCPELIEALDDESFVLKREYRAMLVYADELEQKYKPRGDDLFDLFV